MTGFADFTHKYQVSKTLRFELIPQGKTLENLKKMDLVAEDKARSENYKALKPVIDRIYKYFIEESLKHVNIDWEPLYETIATYRKDKSTTASNHLKEEQDKCRKAVASWFEGTVPEKNNKEIKKFNKKQSKIFKCLFGKKLFSDSLNGLMPDLTLSDKEKELIRSFDKFTTYFIGFYENRRNVFSADVKSTSIPHRLVHDNFPKFIDNCDIYRRIVTAVPELKARLEKAKEGTELFKKAELDEIFSINFYNQLLQQNQIDQFNQLIGGISGEAGTSKIQGLNATLNFAVKQDKELEKKLKNVPHRFTPLFRQILSDRSILPFIPDAFSNDEEVLFSVKEFLDKLKAGSIIREAKALFENLQSSDTQHIYVSASKLSAFSNMVFGEWSLCRDRLYEWKQNGNNPSKKAVTKVMQKEAESWLKNNELAISDLAEALADGLLAEKISLKLQPVFMSLEEKLGEALPAKLQSAEEKASLKSVLDSIQDMYHVIEWFSVDDTSEKDGTFYVPLSNILQEIQPIIPLCNKIRNFVTQKPYSVEKFKLNFSNPALAGGWDENKEQQNGAVLFKKDDKYYLGIFNARNKPDFNKANAVEGKAFYQKMVYKQFPEFSKMMPKCTTQLKEVRKHFEKNDSDYILDNKNFVKPLTITKEIYDLNNVLYDDKKKFQIDYLRRTNDEEGYYTALHTWIDFAKEFVACYKSTAIYDISAVLPTDRYDKLNDFYGTLDNLFYQVRFENVPETLVCQYVEEGSLFLFQLYNKDFAKGSTGMPNLHTIYWKAVFDPENMKNVVVKLNGQAELFYRPKSNMEVIRHKVGEKLVNRTLKTGLVLTDEMHNEIYLYANGKLKKELSDSAKPVLEHAVIYDVHHEIVKDRRFTTDKFFFHVPITLNYKSDKNPIRFNDAVREYLKENTDTYIIGIDRGKRNLIYAVVIDPDGNIVEQKSFNVINGFDYHKKLDQREKERTKAHQAWATVGKIEELKQGYLSLVVYEISKMMIKYNAVVVLENLNIGFKPIRGGIAEKSVYQQFEKMLINKLNYLMFKDIQGANPGSVLNAYQLTDRFESFAKIDRNRQSGFLFYIKTAFTSKIDPTTGFVDPICWGSIKTMEGKKKFISGFDSLKYNVSNGNFILGFNSKRNKEYQKGLEGFVPDWDIVIEANTDRKAVDGTSFVTGKRIDYIRENENQGHYESYLPCVELQKTLEKYGIAYETGENLLPLILEIDDSRLTNSIFKAIRLVLQMRNSNPETGEDYINSPVENFEGNCFDSRVGDETLPKDADANGAYHIALKGRLMLEKIRRDEKNLGISNSEWLNYIQSLRG